MKRFSVLGSAVLGARSGLLVLWFGCTVLGAQNPQALLNRAVDEFEEGRVTQSAATFDEVAKAVPDQAPQLWQRGIALYYAGRYTDCRRQFESHRTVNPDDVENAAWHFLCVAREQAPEKARAALLPVGPDPRPPMREVYQMFRGALSADDVLKAAGSNPSGQFYAHLYIGLYSEALGRKDLALKHIKEAASDRFASVGGYMHMVARVHLRSRN
jgi:lipoprotein NlpI